MGDVILTFSPWDTWRDARVREFCRPPDQLYKSLVRGGRVERLLVADPWRSRPIDVVRRVQGRRAGFPSSALSTHVRPLAWRRSEPASTAALKRRYKRYSEIVRAAARRAGLREPSMVTFNPFVAAFSPLDWCARVVYYGRDDWTAFGRNDRLRAALLAAQQEMRLRDVTVCAVSRVLADRLAGDGNGIVIPNGIDEEIWTTPLPPPSPVRDLPRPCGMYAGTVDDRLDVDTLCDLVRSRRLASIAVIGPVADDEIGARLAREPDIQVVGRLSQRQLVGALLSADVCLLPHLDTVLTEAMSPLKLYEYLAAGAPVVATDLPPVRGVDERVILVADGKYGEAVESALARGHVSESERLAFVRANSWRARHERLLDLLV